jgi:hypothetical protein
VLDAYLAEGGPSGHLGLPTSDRVIQGNGQTRASFEHGAIVIEPGGAVSVVRARTGRGPGQLTGRTPGGGSTRTGYGPGDLTP